MVKIRFSSFSSQDSGINPFEELLLESVEELDFAEDELFVDEDETLLLDLSPLPSLVPSLLLRISLDEDSFSGSTKLLLSSSPQAVNDMVMANSARVRNLQNLIRSSIFS